ncbi:MAG TPA: nucleotide exchange factor GrpE [Burkholderiales bacterium]|nr:nucleotide exchange factor GrpE [Burkholderiales bacterium]
MMQDQNKASSAEEANLADVNPERPAANDPAQEEPALETLLEKAENAAQEHRDAWLRAKADADNIRKRAQSDLVNAHKYALENFSAELIPVRDSLEAALASQNATPEALRSGVELTLKQLTAAFEKFSIREINPLGEKFDPHKHQSINMVESTAEPNTVVAVLQKGYSLNDRILRPALVSIAKPRPEA